MLHGIGISIIDVKRFKAAMEKRGGRLFERLFTQRELSYCLRQRYPEVHLSARFAAKISFFKALGAPQNFKAVEVVRGPSGVPFFKASGVGEGFRLNLSISHTRGYALAETVAEEEKTIKGPKPRNE